MTPKTLRKELRTKFLDKIREEWVDIATNEGQVALAESLADAALELRAFKTDEEKPQYKTGEWTHGDFHDFPEHQWEWARLMRDELGFALPPKPKGKAEKNKYGFWIASFDEMIAAAGEFGTKALEEVIADFKDYMVKHGGVWPFEVTGPQSLVGVVGSKAAKMRMQPAKSSFSQPAADTELAQFLRNNQ